jgi:hypothetical protein
MGLHVMVNVNAADGGFVSGPRRLSNQCGRGQQGPRSGGGKRFEKIPAGCAAS